MTNTIQIAAAAAAITGAAHARSARNGQDAAVAWAGEGIAVVIVTDGCSAGASSEVGARIGANLFARAIAARLTSGATPSSREVWEDARADVRAALAELLERWPGDRGVAIHDHFLFTVVAAAVTRDASAVWALGDGVYLVGGETRALGPFRDNQPPYLAYDLLGEAAVAHFAVAPPCSLVIATDGASELALEQFESDRFVDHPDALRRQLAMLTRSTQRIDWDAQRIVQTPALVQDDIAVGIVRVS